MATGSRIAPTEPKQERAHATRHRLLDAAVDELLDHGYAGLTTQGVARRAGVSRGAQQNYFPQKATLMLEAFRHLALRQVDELTERLEAVPRGRARLEAGLDVLYEHYSGRLFATALELSLAARRNPELEEVVEREERNLSRTLNDAAALIFGDELPSAAARWPSAVAAVRGLALLKRLGHSPASVDRQWQATRRQLIDLLS